MTHDYKTQRADTYESFEQLEEGQTLPERAVVLYQFYAEDLEPDWAVAERALQAKGFRTRIDADEGLLEAAIGPVPLTPDEVWKWEKLATDILLKWDFWPEGWEIE